MAPTTQTRIIRVKVDTTGDANLKKISDQMGRLNRNTKRTSDTLIGFRNAFGGFLASLGVREIARSIDQFQLLQDRIKVFTGSTESAREAFDDLQTSAKLTRTSVASLAEVYNRVALSTQELGLNSEQIIATTTALQQTFRLSGATIAEATAATIQLTQGLSSGQLRGQELRSVLESNAVFSGILSKQLGITRGQLIKFAESGRITSDVVLTALADNFDDLNNKANQLGSTFEQSLTILIDEVRVRLKALNESLGLTSGFETFTKFIVNNFEAIAAGVITLTGVVIFNVGVMTGAFKTLAAAIAANPIGLALVAISVAVGAFAKNWERNTLFVTMKWLEFKQSVLEGAIEVVGTLERFAAATRSFFGIDAIDEDATFKLRQGLKETNEELKNTSERLKELNAESEQTDPFKRLSDSLQNLKTKLNSGPNPIDTIKELNDAFRNSSDFINRYNSTLRQIRIDELNKKFLEGKVTIDQYNSGLLELAQNLSTVDQVALGVEVGLTNVANNAGNVAKNVASGVQSAFKTLEDSLIEFTKKGEFEFSKFAQAILEDINRIIIRAAIIAPLARGVLNASGLSGSQVPSGGGNTVASANGNVFSGGNVIPFANGGVVGSPSFFPLSGGRTGLMGEAGPEAILPLRRKNGRLGVEASGGGGGTVVNVINNTGGEVETRDRTNGDGERILDIIINQKVKDGFANGEFDGSLSEIFGLRRQGR